MCLGIPGRIIERSDDHGLPMGVVDFGGVRRSCCLAYVADEAQVGDYVIVHVGFAISKVQEEEARRTYESLREMSQLDELEWMRESADLALANLQPGASDTTAAAGGNP
jgi:hydrogenase expression/formation protein HypC